MSKIKIFIIRFVIIILFLISIHHALLPRTYKNYFLFDLEQAKYDYIINGPITNKFFKYVNNYQYVDKSSGAFIIRSIISNNNKSVSSSIYLIKNIFDFTKLSYFNSNLLHQGEFEEGQAVISLDIANKLNLRVGDNIDFVIKKEQIHSIKVSGIIKNTAYINNTVLISNTENYILYLPDSNVIYTLLFLKTNNSDDSIKNMIKDKSANISIVSKKEQVNNILKGATLYKDKGLKFIFFSVLCILLILIYYIKKNRTIYYKKVGLYVVTSLLVSITLILIYYKNITNSTFNDLIFKYIL